MNQEKKYIDVTGELPNQELAAGEWYVRHREGLRRIGVGFLVVWSVITIGYSGYRWAEYLFVGYQADQRLLVDAIVNAPNYSSLNAVRGAKDPMISAVDIYAPMPKKYDFVAIVRNPNSRFLGLVTYKFIYPGGETPVKTTVLLPQTERPVAFFGYDSEQFPTAAQLVIQSVRWQRVNSHAIPNIANYMANRLMFPIEGVNFSRANQAGGIPVPRLTFDITNASAYSYWQPVFYLALLAGDQPVGYAYLSLDQFKAGEKRAIDLRLFSDRITVTDIRVFPVLNIFDRSVYMLPE